MMQCEKCQTPDHPDQTGFETCGCTDSLTPPPSPTIHQLESLDKQTEFSCPVCVEESHSLYVGKIHKTQVCFCQSCAGFVIDRSSFGDLVETLRAAYEGPDDQPILIDPSELKKLCMCPACNELMETFNYYGPGNIILDTCEVCQLTWLDQGELNKIVRAPGKRDYGANRNYESQLLRDQLYENAENDTAFLLSQLFSF